MLHNNQIGLEIHLLPVKTLDGFGFQHLTMECDEKQLLYSIQMNQYTMPSVLIINVVRVFVDLKGAIAGDPTAKSSLVIVQ